MLAKNVTITFVERGYVEKEMPVDSKGERDVAGKSEERD